MVAFCIRRGKKGEIDQKTKEYLDQLRTQIKADKECKKRLLQEFTFSMQEVMYTAFTLYPQHPTWEKLEIGQNFNLSSLGLSYGPALVSDIKPTTDNAYTIITTIDPLWIFLDKIDYLFLNLQTCEDYKKMLNLMLC